MVASFLIFEWALFEKFWTNFLTKFFHRFFAPAKTMNFAQFFPPPGLPPQLPNAPPPRSPHVYSSHILEDLFLLLASARPKEGASPELARCSADRNIHSRRLDASDVVAYLLTPVCGVAEFPFTYDNSSCTKVKWHGQMKKFSGWYTNFFYKNIVFQAQARYSY